MVNQLEPLYEIRGLRRLYAIGGEPVVAVNNLDLDLLPGRLVLVSGKSGSGKTTLLNLMGALEIPTSGEIRFKGTKIAHFSQNQLTRWRREEIAFVFQAFALLPGLSARENVDLPLRIAGVAPSVIAERVDHYMGLVGLTKRAEHRVFELSGGEQQRVAIARALVKQPIVVLADEPTGELDRKTGLKVFALFRQLVNEQGISFCLTSHDPAARQFADEIYTLSDGKIVENEDNR